MGKTLSMKEMNQMLAYCKDRYEARLCEDCGQNCRNKGLCNGAHDCEGCLRKIHYGGSKHYNCPYECYFYVMKYFYQYASEITIGCFKAPNNGMQDLVNKPEINVVSIGCGPSSELYGIKLWQYVKGSKAKLNYWGFDTNPAWMELQSLNKGIFSQDNIQYPQDDAFSFMEEPGDTDILILNYVVSDIYKHNPDYSDEFLRKIAGLINDKKIGYLITNDIYLTYSSGTAYAFLRHLAKHHGKLETNPNEVFRCYFDNNNEYRKAFGVYSQFNGICFTQQVDLSAIGPHTQCRSMLEVLKVR